MLSGLVVTVHLPYTPSHSWHTAQDPEPQPPRGDTLEAVQSIKSYQYWPLPKTPCDTYLSSVEFDVIAPIYIHTAYVWHRSLISSSLHVDGQHLVAGDSMKRIAQQQKNLPRSRYGFPGW